jgi:hypothetical protein
VVSKFFKKIFFVFTFLTISFSINLFFQTESKAVGCEKNAGRIVISEDGRDGTQTYVDTIPDPDETVKAPFNYADNYTDTEFNTKNTNACQQEPNEYKVKFYDFYICREDPYKGNASPDFTSCLSIFSNAAGKNITIKPNEAEKLLEGNIQIVAGTYPYAAVVISNQLNIKHKQEYIIILDNDTEVTPDLNGKGDDGTVTGQMWCYSAAIVTTYSGDENIQDSGGEASDYTAAHGVTVVSSSAQTGGARLDCASSEPSDSDVEFATEVFDHLGDEGSTDRFHYPFVTSGYEAEGTSVAGISMAANMLQDDNLTLATTKINAKRIVGFYKYSTPVNINERTIGLKLNFFTSGSVSIDFGQDDTDDKVIWATKMGADPFVVQLQTKERRGRRGRTGDWR